MVIDHAAYQVARFTNTIGDAVDRRTSKRGGRTRLKGKKVRCAQGKGSAGKDGSKGDHPLQRGDENVCIRFRRMEG